MKTLLYRYVSVGGLPAAVNALLGKLGGYKGAIYENLMADTLIKKGQSLYYLQKDSGLELDFPVVPACGVDPISGIFEATPGFESGGCPGFGPNRVQGAGFPGQKGLYGLPGQIWRGRCPVLAPPGPVGP